MLLIKKEKGRVIGIICFNFDYHVLFILSVSLSDIVCKSLGFQKTVSQFIFQLQLHPVHRKKKNYNYEIL